MGRRSAQLRSFEVCKLSQRGENGNLMRGGTELGTCGEEIPFVRTDFCFVLKASLKEFNFLATFYFES